MTVKVRDAESAWIASVRGPGRWSEEEARRVLSAWEASGESLRSFGRRHGIMEQRLWWWKKRLSEWGMGDAGAIETIASAAISLVPMEVRASSPSAFGCAVRVRISDGAVEVELSDPSAVDAGWLAQFVRDAMREPA
jgi:hypothetical protein